ncbi:hypothetical protein [Sorangium sp. So ce124]|uniref:hypothetical protein n=1 Tax=Sorangium sp. So ce124 TaxID=3133280 RepID=UPI003F5F6037
MERALFGFSLTLVVSCLWRLVDQPSEGEEILRRPRASPQTRVGGVAGQETARLTGDARSAGEGLRAPLAARRGVGRGTTQGTLGSGIVPGRLARGGPS